MQRDAGRATVGAKGALEIVGGDLSLHRGKYNQQCPLGDLELVFEGLSPDLFGVVEDLHSEAEIVVVVGLAEPSRAEAGDVLDQPRVVFGVVDDLLVAAPDHQRCRRALVELPRSPDVVVEDPRSVEARVVGELEQVATGIDPLAVELLVEGERLAQDVLAGAEQEEARRAGGDAADQLAESPILVLRQRLLEEGGAEEVVVVEDLALAGLEDLVCLLGVLGDLDRGITVRHRVREEHLCEGRLPIPGLPAIISTRSARSRSRAVKKASVST